jgi:uncharacterized protein
MRNKQFDNMITKCFLIAVACVLFAGCEKKKAPEAPPPVATPEVAPLTIYDHIAQGNSPDFLTWLEQTSNVNERGLNQATPLISAAQFGRTMFVKELLSRGADSDMVDLQGGTALHAAARDGRSEIIRMLLEAGANPTLADYDGLSAYDIAVMMGHEETSRLLADARATYLTAKQQAESTDTSEENISPALLLSTDFRNWNSISGDRIEAAFIQSVFDTVILQSRDGNFVRIQINRLVPEDQTIIRQLTGLDPHVLANARTKSVKSAAQKRQTDSMALRVSREKDWTVLENCKLDKNSSNDGDSFHVRHDGKEYIFRLYFVDAAETNSDFPDRVEDQARYFDLSETATLKLGHEAARFTTSLLASAPFTVITRWEDARGNSQLQRHYAMVVTPLGDLDEILTREGLVRQFGMTINSSLGNRKTGLLKKLEQDAKQQNNGAWRKQDRMAEK